MDPSRSSTNPHVHKDVRWAEIGLSEGEGLRLHIFLDRSVVEVLANGRVCVTDRIYPARKDSLGLDLFSHGGTVELSSLHIWEMQGIWE